MLILQSLKYQSIVFTDRIKQGSQFDVSLLYSKGVSFMEVQEGLKSKHFPDSFNFPFVQALVVAMSSIF